VKKLVAKFKRFQNDQNGMEFIEVAAIVIGAIALAAAIYVLMKNVGDSVSGVSVSIPAADFSYSNSGG